MSLQYEYCVVHQSSPLSPLVVFSIQRSTCYSFPNAAQWEGDGLEKDIGIEAAGKILYKYAYACVAKVQCRYLSETRAHGSRPKD